MQLGDVRTIQFEVWQNCNNGCTFCYLNGSRIIHNPKQQIEDIKKVRSVINSDKLNDYNAIGLIGGEFFQGQLKNPEVKEHWLMLMQDMANYLKEGKLVECWITASLMSADLTDLYESFDLFPKDKKILISTSYDEKGRFHSEEQRQIWLNNLKLVHERYPQALVHTQIIVTQDFLDRVLKDDSIIREILKYSGVDFKLPSVYRKDYTKLNVYNAKSYHDLLLKTYKEFPDGFFIKSRSDFMKFIKKMTTIFDVDKIQWFCRNEVRSKTLYLLGPDKVIEDRWDTNDDHENAECGHVYDSYCYLDSDKCARCDAMKIYEQLKEAL